MLESCWCFPLGEEAERESTVGDVSGPWREFESIPVARAGWTDVGPRRYPHRYPSSFALAWTLSNVSSIAVFFNHCVMAR